MKKFFALLLSGVLCASVVYTAIAADEDPEGDNVVVTAEEETTTQPSTSIDDLAAALGDDKQAQEIADKIQSAVQSGATQEDVNALLLSLTDYVNSKGYDLADLRSKEGAKKFVGKFLEDCGVDSKALGEAIKGMDEISDNLFGNGSSSSSGSSSSAGSESFDYNGSGASYGVASMDIPDTGVID